MFFFHFVFLNETQSKDLRSVTSKEFIVWRGVISAKEATVIDPPSFPKEFAMRKCCCGAD
jgi:hypothetical protein